MRACLFLGAGLFLATFSSGVTAAEAKQKAATLDVRFPVKLQYLVALPADYDSKSAWPLLLFLHGSGERGNDLEQVKRHGPPKLIEQGRRFPMIVITPQCPPDRWWDPVELTALLDEATAKYKVDRDRVYVTGLSMGGFGSWSLAAWIPDRIAAIVPICGGGQPGWAKQLATMPVWVFHGAKDPGVPLKRAQEMVDALEKKKNDKVKLTVYPEAGHDSWTVTYDNPAVYEWLLEQKRTETAPIRSR